MNIRIGKISIYGSAQEIKTAKAILEQHLPEEQFDKNESAARLKIQSLIDAYNIKARILWEGNNVWSKRRVLNDFKIVLQKGMQTMTDHLYEFFHLSCGSIAHYDKQGWICCYPDIEALRGFFEKNEYGLSVLNHQPWWASDRIKIIKDINLLLNIKENK